MLSALEGYPVSSTQIPEIPGSKPEAVGRLFMTVAHPHDITEVDPCEVTKGGQRLEPDKDTLGAADL